MGGQAPAGTGRPALVNEKGYWLDEDEAVHTVCPGLRGALLDFFAEEGAGTTVADFGCGRGDYAAALAAAGFAVRAYDGNPNVEAMSGGVGKPLDLSARVDVGPADWVMSFEVGEHLPREFEQVFLDNLARHARRGLIVSWAVPGQGGRGHFNERPLEYVRAEVARRGFAVDEAASARLRGASTLSWFRRNIHVYRKPAAKN